MTDPQAKEIHEELREIKELVGKLLTAEAVRTSECANRLFRTQNLERAVFDDPHGLMHRTTVLETARASAKWVLVTAAAVAGAIGGIGSAIANWLKG